MKGKVMFSQVSVILFEGGGGDEKWDPRNQLRYKDKPQV